MPFQEEDYHFMVKDVEEGPLNHDENEPHVLDPFQRRPKGVPNLQYKNFVDQ